MALLGAGAGLGAGARDGRTAAHRVGATAAPPAALGTAPGPPGRAPGPGRRSRRGRSAPSRAGRWPPCWPAAGGYALPTLLAGRGERTRQVARTEAIAGWAEMLRDTLSAAAGLEQAILATAPVAPAPIRTEVLALAERLGSERLIPALRQFATELADPTGDLVVAALVLASGNEARRLAELLSSLAAGRSGPGRHAAAGRGGPSPHPDLLPSGGGGDADLRRWADHLEPLLSVSLRHADWASSMLGVIGLLFAGAFVWLARLGRPTVPERFLAAQTPVDAVTAALVCGAGIGFGLLLIVRGLVPDPGTPGRRP